LVGIAPQTGDLPGPFAIAVATIAALGYDGAGRWVKGSIHQLLTANVPQTAARPAKGANEAPLKIPPATVVRAPPAFAGMAIGLLGGSFNPAHAGHRLISVVALQGLGLDRVWWLVSPGNPLKDPAVLAPLEVRLELAAKVAGHPRIIATGLEAGLGSPYTIDTLGYLRRRYRGVRFVWLMGADNLAGLHHWRDWRAIMHLAQVAVFDRPGWRYRALASPAATCFRRQRLAGHQAGGLARRHPPAWIFAGSRLSALSSSELRAGAEQPT